MTRATTTININMRCASLLLAEPVHQSFEIQRCYQSINVKEARQKSEVLVVKRLGSSTSPIHCSYPYTMSASIEPPSSQCNFSIWIDYDGQIWLGDDINTDRFFFVSSCGETSSDGFVSSTQTLSQLRFHPDPTPCWSKLEPSWSQVGTKLGKLGVKLGPSWGQVG